MSTSSLSSTGTSPGAASAAPLYALVGNPNCGKTTLFNALTGLRQKVGNYPGVTVEKKEGRLRLPDGSLCSLIDLPGLYSLTPRSPDEAIARDVLLGHRADVQKPAGIIHVLDGSNLERNLYLTSQILDIGIPTLVVLTMTDVARRSGQTIDAETLQKELGVPVRSVLVSEGAGMAELRAAIGEIPQTPPPPRRVWSMPEPVQEEVSELAELLVSEGGVPENQSGIEAIGLLMQEKPRPEEKDRWPKAVLDHVRGDREHFKKLGVDFSDLVIESRYEWVRHVHAHAVTRPEKTRPTLTDKLDRVLTHRIWGYVIFFGVMAFVFQTIFTWANVPMNWIADGVSLLSKFVSTHMPAGDLQDLLVNGVIAGVGTTITFLPQILLLFFFIALLEDTGYMARAAFLMDKIMSKVGLHGKSFIPLLSSFACAIPGIMATRTIDDRRSRLVTILVAPLMTCSARIPVYTLLIAAFIPQRKVLGVFTLPGLTMMAMYFLGMLAAFGMAWVFKRTLLRGQSPVFFLEMPPYHRPSLRTVVMTMLERAYLFLRRAGTVILSVSIVLWFLTSYPKPPAGTPPEAQMATSYAGHIGKAIEPAIRPLGFDWRVGVCLVSSFIAREVFVSSAGVMWGVGDKTADPDQVSASLQEKIKHDPFFTPLRAVSIMIYYVLAMQCLSTVAVVKRETNGWKWPLFMIGYMTALAWLAAFLTFRVGLLMHWGVR